MRIAIAVSLAVAIGAAGFGLHAIVAAQPTPANNAPLIDRIAYVYHGVALDRDMREIRPTRAGIEASLDRIIANGSPANAAGALRALDRTITLARADNMVGPELRLALKGAKAELLLASQAYRPMTASNLEFLREWLKADTARLGAATRGTGPLRKAMNTNKLQLDPSIYQVAVRWWPDFQITPVKLSYGLICSINKVPTPPDWGSSGWTRKTDGATTTIPYSKLYILNTSNYSTEVWTSGDSTTDGGCLALPRTNTTTGSITLGVICQRASTGKACFYDNRPHEGGSTFTAAQMAGTKKKISKDWVNGYDSALSGGGICTDCHRGENAFILHNQTLLSNSPAMPFETDAAVWYKMLNSLGWSNPPKTSFSTSGGCTSCHEIGSTTDARKGSYCDILRLAAEAEMPSTASPATWSPSSGSAYRAHIDQLKTNC